MLDEMTIRKLGEMRLPGMAEQFRLQMEDPSFQNLSFQERFGLLVDAEWTRRRNTRLTQLIRKAQLHESSACVENIEYHADRKLDKTLIIRLASCSTLPNIVT